jgi:hypothetical protein
MQKIISAILAAGRTPFLAKVPFAERSSVDLWSLREYNQVVEELGSENHIAVPPPDFYSYFQAHPGELADGILTRTGQDTVPWRICGWKR